MRFWMALVVLLWVPGMAAQVEQVHVGLVDDELLTGISLVWAEPGDLSSERPMVRFDETDGNGFWERAATGQYIAPDTTIFTVELLHPIHSDGNLSYRFLDRDHPGGEIRRQASDDRWRFVAYGDQGTGLESEAAEALVPIVAALQPNAVLHVGDLSYSNARPAIWNDWFGMIEPLASSTFYMAAPGNHEHEGYYPATSPGADQLENAHDVGAITDPYRQFQARFHYGPDDLRYSFDVGPVHVTVINTEQLCAWEPAQYYVPWRANPRCDTPSDTLEERGIDDQESTVLHNEELRAWVESDLANNQAQWNFVMMHQPAYSAGSYTGRAVLQQHYVPLFEQYGVDVVLAGHDHNYQRSYPLQAGVPALVGPGPFDPDAGPVYIVTGGGGEGRYGVDEGPEWLAVGNATYHYTQIDATADALHVVAVETLSGQVIDEFWIGQPPETPTPATDNAQPAPALPAMALLVGLLSLAAGLRASRP